MKGMAADHVAVLVPHADGCGLMCCSVCGWVDDDEFPTKHGSRA